MSLRELGLRGAYEYLRFYEKCRAEGGFSNPEKADEHIIKLKREIRGRHKAPDDRQERLIKDYGIDGYIIRFNLPSCIETREEAEEYFDEYERLECRPSMYDCTGDLFTSWHSIFNINGKWVCYHSIGCDV